MRKNTEAARNNWNLGDAMYELEGDDVATEAPKTLSAGSRREERTNPLLHAEETYEGRTPIRKNEKVEALKSLQADRQKIMQQLADLSQQLQSLRR